MDPIVAPVSAVNVMITITACLARAANWEADAERDRVAFRKHLHYRKL